MILPSMSLPIPILMAAIGIPLIICLCLVFFLFDLKKYGPEGFTFRDCRKHNKPCMDLTDAGSGDSSFVAGDVEKNGDINFKYDEYGIKLDPRKISSKILPSRYKRGLVIYHYGTTATLPTDARTAMGQKKIEEVWRKPKYKNLQWMPPQVVFQLLSTPRDERLHDIKMFCSQYEPDIFDDGFDYTPDDIAGHVLNKINALEEETSETPIEEGFFSYQVAIRDNPQAFSSQALKNYEYTLWQKFSKMLNDALKFWQNPMLWVIAIIISGAVAVYIVSIAM